MLTLEGLSRSLLGAAIEVHRALGPGLLESAYAVCFCTELGLRGLQYQRQVPLSIVYKGQELSCGYRMDLVVAGSIIVELKSVEAILPIHGAQLLTYLRLSGLRVGLLINWNVGRLMDGVVRRVV